MNARQELQFRSISECVDLLKPLPPDDPELAEVRRARDRLSRQLQEIVDVAAKQAAAFKGRTAGAARVGLARRQLRTLHLIPTSRRAKPLFRNEAALLRALRVPPARATPQQHVDAALAMAKALRPHMKFCHKEGFSPGFLPRLKAAAEALRKADRGSDEARRELSVTTLALRRALSRGREELRLLDSLVDGYILSKGGMYSGSAIHFHIETWKQKTKLGKRLGRPPKRKHRRAPRGESVNQPDPSVVTESS
jgi:hypothetical protein